MEDASSESAELPAGLRSTTASWMSPSCSRGDPCPFARSKTPAMISSMQLSAVRFSPSKLRSWNQEMFRMYYLSHRLSGFLRSITAINYLLIHSARRCFPQAHVQNPPKKGTIANSLARCVVPSLHLLRVNHRDIVHNHRG